MTNVHGPENIVRAIRELELPIETVVGISTDKAVKPVNVMGMTKALQERVFAGANLASPDTRFIIVRYGNVWPPADRLFHCSTSRSAKAGRSR